MTQKEALKRIEALERRVRELEARPTQIIQTLYPVAPEPAPPMYPWTTPVMWC